MLQKISLSKILAVILLSISATFANASILAEKTPQELTEIYANKTFDAIKENAATISKDPDFLKTIIKNQLIEAVNVPYTGALILGTYYRNYNSEQLAKYNKALTNYIIYQYAQLLSIYKGENIQFNDQVLTSNGQYASVPVIIQTSKSIKVDFKWRKQPKTGEWQVYDLSAEGISMVSTKASEWAPILKASGIEGVINLITEQSNKSINVEK